MDPMTTSRRRSFTAATWNAFHGTPRAVLEPVFRRQLVDHRGVGLVFGQEMQQAHVRQMFTDFGWGLAYAAPQWVIAWDPAVWTANGPCEKVPLAETGWQTGGGHDMESASVMQRLTHRATGRLLAGMSYHLASAVQVADPQPNRLQSTRESARTWRRVQRHELAAGADAVMFAGDDNVFEQGAHGPWAFMLRAATGLRQVQAPAATHAGGRKIDDFRIRGSLTVGHGDVVRVPAPDDHNIHVRTFGWAA